MKRILTLILCFGFIGGSVSAHTVDSLFAAGNKAYDNKDYVTALQCYSRIVQNNVQSAAVFYNMGNAYFRTRDLGHAILYYERALRLDPRNTDIQINLKVAYAGTKDDLVSLEPFFLQRWIHRLAGVFSSNGWSVFFAICFLSALWLLFLFLRKTFFYRQKLIFALLCLSLCFSSVSLWGALYQRNEAVKTDEAVVMQSELQILSSPDETSSEVLLIHEGQKVKILDRLNDWVKIRVVSGRAGWIKNTAIEVI